VTGEFLFSGEGNFKGRWNQYVTEYKHGQRSKDKGARRRNNADETKEEESSGVNCSPHGDKNRNQPAGLRNFNDSEEKTS